MKELIQNSSGEVAIVIYDAPLPPKYFRFSKKFIRTLFFVFPLLTILSLLILFAWGLGSRLKDAPAPKFPELMSESDRKILELETELKSLQEVNTKISDKLAGQVDTGAAKEQAFLLYIKQPYGMQDLTSQKKVALDQFEYNQDSNESILKFQIINSDQEIKTSGHIIVFMISDLGMLAYPSEVNLNPTQGAKYSSGEPFSVSRLRPTIAGFKQAPTTGSVKFVIYIFSREGDLLLIQETGPYKAGAKS